jgi:SAM-dependent methyltransferase
VLTAGCDAGSVTGRAAYETIGHGYVNRRVPDARIAAQIHASLGDAETVLNVGAGTGSYEPTDRRVVSVEPSELMLAQRPASAAPAIQGVAEALPIADDAFDVALAILTVHHWRDVDAGLRELRRVARQQVLFSFDLTRQPDLWFAREYVPASIAMEEGRAPGIEQLVGGLGGARVEPILIPHDCSDGFLGAYWRRPEAYLDPDVRASISSLAQLDQADVDPGVERLAADLASGEWHEQHADLLDLEELDLGYRLLITA